MNVDLQQLLTERGDAAEAPRLDPRDVVARGEQLVRRRRALATAATALVVAATLAVTGLLTTPDRDRPAPVGPVEVPQWSPGSGTRPLAYGQGQALHLADRTIDTGIDFLSIDPTDEGAVLTTLDGGIWFTDGETVERIGTTLGVRRLSPGSISYFVGRPREWVASGDAGPLVAWMEFTGQRVDEPELVVYDSAVGSVVARQPLEVAQGNSALVVDVVGRHVYAGEDFRGSFEPTATFRYDVDDRVLEEVSDAEVAAARRQGARLVVGTTAEGAVLHSPARTVVASHSVDTVGVRDGRMERLIDPRTGHAVAIAAPESDGDGHMWFTQWLDEDRFVLAPDAGLGQLVLCSISAGRCDAVVDGLVRDDPGPALTPGDGLRGAELALGRAIQARTRQQ